MIAQIRELFFMEFALNNSHIKIIPIDFNKLNPQSQLKMLHSIKLLRTNSRNKDFIILVKQLDAELAIIDGDDHSFYNQFNKIDTIKHAIVAYLDDTPVACGAIKQYDLKTMEIKRMFTMPMNRGFGFSKRILSELEQWVMELNFKKCILETGKKQPEAIEFYKNYEYKLTANYGQYAGVENSLCFEKKLS